MNVDDFRLPAEFVTRLPPVNLRLEDARLFEAERTRTYPEVGAVTVEQVRVHANGVCLRQAGFLHRPALIFPPHTVSWRNALKASLMITRTALRGTRGLLRREYQSAVLFCDLYLSGFYHWISDILPKLAVLESAGVDLRGERWLLPGCRDANYVRDSLAAFGINAEVIRPNEYAAVERLKFLPRIAPSGNHRPAVMQQLSKTLRTHFGTNKGGRRIYISRRDAAKRRVLNEADLLPLLDLHGFEVVCMEDLTFAEQVRLSANCTVIAGLHGAGLTHMLWMPPGGRVIEIRANGDDHNNCYYGLASDLGHKYFYVLSQKQSDYTTTQRADFMVDVRRFGQALEALTTYEQASDDGNLQGKA